jgi:Mg-chelatase subunit ChlD
MMKSNLFARGFVVILLVAGIVWTLSSSSSAQSGRKRSVETASPNQGASPKESERERTTSRPLADNTPVAVDENGTIKMDTALVTIPVSVIDRDGRFVPSLKKRDFQLYEDGVEQDIENLTSVETPFHVALVLDTSNSTVLRLEDIQDAAFAFIKELRQDDQVMIVSFDSKVRFHCDFTNDPEALRRAIDETRTGGSTKLYEAVDKVVDRLADIEGRKAIVLFTDGVDTTSRRANFQNTLDKV